MLFIDYREEGKALYNDINREFGSSNSLPCSPMMIIVVSKMDLGEENM